MKLLFASITYGTIDPQAVRSQRAAIMHAARHGGVEWRGDVSPDRLGYAAARNLVVKTALDDAGDADALFWCDSDIVLPVDSISKMANRGFDLLTGIYFQRIPPHWPLIATFNPRKESFEWLVKWPKDALFPADGCGFGIVLTSLKLLRDMGQMWFTYDRYSEDFDFCLKAKKLGYQLMVDSSVVGGHLPDPKPITEEDFLREREKRHPELFAPGGKE